MGRKIKSACLRAWLNWRVKRELKQLQELLTRDLIESMIE